MDENGRRKSFGATGKEACRWGDDCRNYRRGVCKYGHTEQMKNSGVSGKETGGWGDDCRNYRRW